MSNDAIVLLKQDHKEIENLFRAFTAGPNAAMTKGDGLGRTQLADLGARMVEARKTAPRTPASPTALKNSIDAVIR